MNLYTGLSLNNVLLEQFPFSSEVVMESFLVENPSVLSLDDGDLSRAC